MNAYSFLASVKEKNPLVHHLTNWVTIYDCAQIVKSLGASPVMAHAPEEVEEMNSIASSLVINIGTLTEDFIKSSKKAALAANSRNIPVILDVCGAGATAFRDRKSMELLNETRIDVIKGNASEVARIAGFSVKTKGVDSADVNENLEDVARGLAAERSCTVVITGKQDIIAGNNSLYKVDNGADMMAMVVGTGCMAASVIGTFAGASPEDYTSAAAAGLACFGIAGELALAKSDGPGSFKTALLDCAAELSQEDVVAMQKITE